MSPEQKFEEEIYTEDWIMVKLGYTKRTIQQLRHEGSPRLPPHKKLGARYVYPVKDFMEWYRKLAVNRGVG